MPHLQDKTVRIGPVTHQTLQELSAQMGESMQQTLARAVEEYRRRRFLEGVNADFAALRNDPTAWQQEQQERAEWDATLADGLLEE